MSIWIRCPECGDNGPHTVLRETSDPLVVACINEWCGVVFDVAREEIE